jgi:hypothetical protein
MGIEAARFETPKHGSSALEDGKYNFYRGDGTFRPSPRPRGALSVGPRGVGANPVTRQGDRSQAQEPAYGG